MCTLAFIRCWTATGAGGWPLTSRDDLIHLAAAGPAVPVGGPGDVTFGQLGQGGPDLGDGQAHPLAGADHGDAA